jgi:hypothetical protein
MDDQPAGVQQGRLLSVIRHGQERILHTFTAMQVRKWISAQLVEARQRGEAYRNQTLLQQPVWLVSAEIVHPSGGQG